MIISIISGMIVCVCNSLCSKQLDKAISQGISSACEFYSSAGCKMQCGKCLDYVEETIDRKTSPFNTPDGAVFGY